MLLGCGQVDIAGRTTGAINDAMVHLHRHEGALTGSQMHHVSLAADMSLDLDAPAHGQDALFFLLGRMPQDRPSRRQPDCTTSQARGLWRSQPAGECSSTLRQW